MTLWLWLLLFAGPQEDAALLLARGDEQQALSIYRRRLEQDPDDRAAAWQVGYILYSRDDLEGARAIFQQAERRHGRQAYSAYMLGVIAEREFRYTAALALYRQSVGTDAGYAPADEGVERLEQMLADLARFRTARDRLSAELVAVLAAVALLALLAHVLIGRMVSSRET